MTIARGRTSRNYQLAAAISLMPAALAQSQTCGAQWTRALDGLPPARNSHAAVFDPVRGETVVFGGIGNTTGYAGLNFDGRVLGDAWSWNGTRWRLISMGRRVRPLPSGSTSPGPAGVVRASLTFNSATGSIVVDGGSDAALSNSVASDQLWELAGDSWSVYGGTTAQSSPTMPKSTLWFAPAGPLLSTSGGGTYLDGSSWRSLTSIGPGVPALRDGGIFAQITLPGSGSNLLFYPNSRSSTPPAVYLGNLAVVRPPVSVSWIATSMNQGPSARQVRGVWDSSRRRMVVHGGESAAGVALGDTWEWSGETPSWQQFNVAGPGGRIGHAMAFDASRNATVFFGGTLSRSGSAQLISSADVWEWNGAVWTDRTPAGIRPRFWHAMAYDVANRRTVLFGGTDQQQANGGVSAVSDETWSYDGVRWTRLPAAPDGPVGRYRHAMTYDRTRGRVVLFGGFNPMTGASLNDTWELDGVVWRLIDPAGPTPPPRRGHGLVYDDARGSVIVIGGDPDGSMWELRGSVWSPLTGGIRRRDFGVAYDVVRDRVVVFGGRDPANTNSVFGDTLEWDGAAWTTVANTSPDPALGVRSSPALAYDRVRGRAVLFGGSSQLPVSGDPRYDDTWEWNGAVWGPVQSAGPRARAGTSMVYDDHRARMVLFGGDISYAGRTNGTAPQEFGDTWEFSMTGFSAGITRQATIASRLWEPGSTFTISAGAAGGGPGSPFSVRWLKNGAPLVDGPGVSGSQTEILTVNNAAYADSGTYSFEVRSACGASRSSVFVTVRCAADVTGTGGQPDQSVTIEDLTAYLQLFQTGAGGADVDDGSGTGLLDRAVTVDDLLYFLQRYELGC